METEGNGRFYRKDRKGIRKERENYVLIEIVMVRARVANSR
jgi:hypothetical protein